MTVAIISRASAAVATPAIKISCVSDAEKVRTKNIKLIYLKKKLTTFCRVGIIRPLVSSSRQFIQQFGM